MAHASMHQRFHVAAMSAVEQSRHAAARYHPSIHPSDHGARSPVPNRMSPVPWDPLAERLPDHAGPADVAVALAAIWQDVESALAPILGSRGVVALYRRSAFLIANEHPWIAAADVAGANAIDLDALRRAMTAQGGAEAAAGARRLLQTFHGLLTSLVGEPLTHRLLEAVRTTRDIAVPSEASAQ